MLLRRYGATMLLGLVIASMVGVVVALLIILTVGNPQALSASGGRMIGLFAIYGLVPGASTGLAAVIGAGVALARYDPRLTHPARIRDRLISRGAALAAGGAWLVFAIVLGLASPQSWQPAAGVAAVGAGVALVSGMLAVALVRLADHRLREPLTEDALLPPRGGR